jgi:hypothetical protein
MPRNRLGGIAAVCTPAFRPYSSILSALAETCYWWGWVPPCGVTPLLSAKRSLMVPARRADALIASTLVAPFTAANRRDVRWAAFMAVPTAAGSSQARMLLRAGSRSSKLSRAAGLLLDDDGPRSNPPADDDVADFDPFKIAAAQLAVRRQIEHGVVTNLP